MFSSLCAINKNIINTIHLAPQSENTQRQLSPAVALNIQHISKPCQGCLQIDSKFHLQLLLNGCSLNHKNSAFPDVASQMVSVSPVFFLKIKLIVQKQEQQFYPEPYHFTPFSACSKCFPVTIKILKFPDHSPVVCACSVTLVMRDSLHRYGL